MRVVIDTNIVFSAILKSDSLIAKIILQSGNRFNFYTTDLLNQEIIEHKTKLQKLSGLTSSDLEKSIAFITRKIRFVDAQFIPDEIFRNAEILLHDIDIDDVEFVALTEHIRGKLWSGDNVLIEGLKKKNWKKTITTIELQNLVVK
jgi:predicted nucleic acid-binding protein